MNSNEYGTLLDLSLLTNYKMRPVAIEMPVGCNIYCKNCGEQCSPFGHCYALLWLDTNSVDSLCVKVKCEKCGSFPGDAVGYKY